MRRNRLLFLTCLCVVLAVLGVPAAGAAVSDTATSTTPPVSGTSAGTSTPGTNTSADASPPVTLSGRVVAFDGTPLSDASVVVHEDTGGTNPVRTVTGTDASGNWSVTLESDTSYHVVFHQGELAVGAERPLEPVSVPRYPDDGVPDVHVLEPGQFLTDDHSLGTRRLPRAYRLDVRAVNRTSGVPAVPVELTGYDDSGLVEVFSLTYRTDENGDLVARGTASPGLELRGQFRLEAATPRGADLSLSDPNRTLDVDGPQPTVALRFDGPAGSALPVPGEGRPSDHLPSQPGIEDITGDGTLSSADVDIYRAQYDDPTRTIARYPEVFDQTGDDWVTEADLTRLADLADSGSFADVDPARSTVSPGGETTLTYTLTNPATGAQNLLLEFTSLPAGVSVASVDGDVSQTLLRSSPPGLVTTELAPGESATVSATVTAGPTAPAGERTVTATATVRDTTSTHTNTTTATLTVTDTDPLVERFGGSDGRIGNVDILGAVNAATTGREVGGEPVTNVDVLSLVNYVTSRS